MPTSVRMDSHTESTLVRLARKRKASKSAVLREAIELLARRDRQPDTGGGLFERAGDLIGCVPGGDRKLSSRTGEGFRRLLRNRPRR